LNRRIFGFIGEASVNVDPNGGHQSSIYLFDKAQSCKTKQKMQKKQQTQQNLASFSAFAAELAIPGLSRLVPVLRETNWPYSKIGLSVTRPSPVSRTFFLRSHTSILMIMTIPLCELTVLIVV
jgi:hypothetical protein